MPRAACQIGAAAYHEATKTRREKDMATHFDKVRWGTVACGFCLLMGTPLGQATDTFTATQGAEKVSKGKKAKAPKPPKDKSTGENLAQRDKRLLRECKGRPNAGACEGYAN
jgi:hypothetical protein